MSSYEFLALLLNMCEPSCLGPHSWGFPPPRNLPPTISALSHKMISTSYPNIVDLVKIDLVHMQKSLFTHEGVKSNFYVDHLSHCEGFYSDFCYAWASLPIYSSPKCNQQNLIFQFSACKFWNITQNNEDVGHSLEDLGEMMYSSVIFQNLHAANWNIKFCWFHLGDE